MAQRAPRPGLRLDLHQGHGGAAASRSRPTTSSAASRRPAATDTRVHVHVHATTGVTLVSLMKAIEAGADIVDTVDLVAEPRPRPQPDRGAGRDARGHRLHDPAGQGPAAADQGPLRQGPAALRRVRVEVHRRRDRDLRQPDPRRHDLEHGEPAQAAGRRRPRSRRCSPRCRSVRKDAGLPAAGHAVEPDRRHAGGVQRADGPLQGADRRVRRPDARLLRRDARRARPGGRRGRRAGTPRRSRSPAGRPTCSSPSGTSCAPRRSRSRAATAPTRTCSPSPCSRRSPRSSSPTRPEGPKNVGKDPSAAGDGAPAPGADAVRTPITYQVTVNGTAHSVSVTAPA